MEVQEDQKTKGLILRTVERALTETFPTNFFLLEIWTRPFVVVVRRVFFFWDRWWCLGVCLVSWGWRLVLVLVMVSCEGFVFRA